MARLGDLCALINGFAFKPSDWKSEGLPIIRIQNLNDESATFNYFDGEIDEKYIVNDGDLLFSWSGTPGTSFGAFFWVRGRGVLNQHIFKVHPVEEVTKKYLRYALNGNMNRIIDRAHGGVGLQHITKKELVEIDIPVISVAEQNKIVSVIEKVEEIITLQKEQLVKLDELVKSRFIELFGGIHDSKMYPYKLVKDLTDVVSGGTPSRDVNEYWEGGTIPWVKTTELQNNYVTEVEEYITEEGLNNSSAKIVPAGTVLIAMYGQGKTRGMTAYLGIEACTNQACACILPSDKINQTFLWQFLILSYDNLRDMAKGGNQPNLNGNIIKNYLILYPPRELQEQFATFVEQTDKSKLAIRKSLEELETLKKSLMQKYFG